MSVLKKAKKIGQVSIRDLKQETEKDTQEIISVINVRHYWRNLYLYSPESLVGPAF